MVCTHKGIQVVLINRGGPKGIKKNNYNPSVDRNSAVVSVITLTHLENRVRSWPQDRVKR